MPDRNEAVFENNSCKCFNIADLVASTGLAGDITPALWRELEALQRAALSPHAVITAATLNGARVLGLEQQPALAAKKELN